MPGAHLGAVVVVFGSLLAACDAPAPPAGTVARDAAPTTTTLQEASPETTTTTEPELVTTTTAYDWGEVLCETQRHPRHHEPCPAYSSPPMTSGGLRPSTASTAPAQSGSGRCGGSLPPCSVMRAESGGDPTAIGYGQCGTAANPRNCQGKWQIDPVTAESVGYPRNLAEQPESVQDEAARAILARDGCQAWSTC